MTKRSRRTVFYLLVCLFPVLGVGALLYAQGWRIDLLSLDIGKVGAVYVDTLPKDAEILVDGDPVKRGWSIFERGVLINNLFPKSYAVSVRKAGYHTWQVSAEVEPSRIVSFRNVVLVPRERMPAREGNIDNFHILENNLLLSVEEGAIFSGENHIPGNRLIATNDTGETVLVATSSPRRYTLYNARQGTGADVTSALRNAEDDTVLLSPRNVLAVPERNAVVVRTPTRLTLLDGAIPGTLQTIARESPAIFAASEDWISWSIPSEEGSVVSFYSLSQQATSSTTIILPGETRELRFTDDDTIFALQDTGALYTMNIGEGIARSVADGAHTFAVSENRAMLAVVGDENIELIPLGGGSNYGRVNIPDVRAIKKIAWYDDNAHLFVEYADRVAFLDLSDRELQNLIIVTDSSTWQYDQATDRFYALEANGTISVLQFPN